MNAVLTVYAANRRRSHQVVERMFGTNFGWMLSGKLPYCQHERAGHSRRG
jgi:hypothetical protein